MVGIKEFESLRLAAHAPKACVSTGSTISPYLAAFYDALWCSWWDSNPQFILQMKPDFESGVFSSFTTRAYWCSIPGSNRYGVATEGF